MIEAQLFKWAGLIWTNCRTRKSCSDYATAKLIPAKSKAYRPLTNSKYRVCRIASIPAEAVMWLGAR